jgi:hypothetical protein
MELLHNGGFAWRFEWLAALHVKARALALALRANLQAGRLRSM